MSTATPPTPPPPPPLIGEAIIHMERSSAFLHNAQRMQELDAAPLHDRVAMLIGMMNTQLSMPDERRESALTQHTKDLLRNTAVKSQLGTFLAFQSQLDRLAKMVSTVGTVDTLLADKSRLEGMETNQLIALQKSLHTQIQETIVYVERQKLEGLDTLINNIEPASVTVDGTSINKGLTDLNSAQRERVKSVLARVLREMGEEEKTSAVVDV